MVTVAAAPAAMLPSPGSVTAIAAVNCSSPSISVSSVIGIDTVVVLAAPPIVKAMAPAV